MKQKPKNFMTAITSPSSNLINQPAPTVSGLFSASACLPDSNPILATSGVTKNGRTATGPRAGKPLASATCVGTQEETLEVAAVLRQAQPAAVSTQPAQPKSQREWKRGCYPRTGKLTGVDETWLTNKLGQPLDTIREDLFSYLLRNREEFVEGLRWRLQLHLQTQVGYFNSNFNFFAALVYELPFSYTPIETGELERLITTTDLQVDYFLLPLLAPMLSRRGQGELPNQPQPQMQLVARQLTGATILDALGEILAKTCVTLPAQNLTAFLAHLQPHSQEQEQEEPGLPTLTVSRAPSCQPQPNNLEQLHLDLNLDFGEAARPLSPSSYRSKVVEQLQNKNLSLQKTAQLLNISYMSVCRLRKRGEPKYANVSDCQIFYELLAHKLSRRELIGKLGVSDRTIRKSFIRVMNTLVEALLIK